MPILGGLYSPISCDMCSTTNFEHISHITICKKKKKKIIKKKKKKKKKKNKKIYLINI